MPYCCANVPRSGWMLELWVMLPIQVALCELTGRVEMSALKTLSAGKREQVVPGIGSACARVAPGTHNAPATTRAAANRPALGPTKRITVRRRDDCEWRKRLG